MHVNQKKRDMVKGAACECKSKTTAHSSGPTCVCTHVMKPFAI